MADQGAGVSITFDSGYFAAMDEGSWSGISREIIENTTCATTGGRTYELSDQYDPGSIEIGFLLAPGTTPDVIDGGAAGNCTVTWTDSGAATWAASALFANLDIEWASGANNGRVRGSATLKLTGNITVTP